MDRTKKAVLFRKRADARVPRLAMQGRAEDIIKYFQSIPPKLRSDYFIRDGEAYYGPREIERLARQFNMAGRWEDPTVRVGL
jgi:hypothetical protein